MEFTITFHAPPGRVRLQSLFLKIWSELYTLTHIPPLSVATPIYKGLNNLGLDS